MMRELETLEGQTFGGYQIERMLGKGSLSTVYLGRSIPDPTHTAAIKIIRPTGRAEAFDQLRLHFTQQVALVRQLRHAHILMILAAGEQNGLFYQALPLITGKPLVERIAAGPLPLDRVQHLGNQAADALAFAHARNVVHGDLTPTNILIDDQDNMYLSDFGMRTFIAQAGGPQPPLDPYGFLAPEPPGGQAITPEADQYSLACCYFALVTGQMPAQVRRGQQLPAPMELRPDLPLAASMAILRALGATPGDPFPSVMAFSMAFVAALRGGAGALPASRPLPEVSQQRYAAAPETRPLEIVTAPTSRRQFVLAATGGVAALALGGVGLAYFYRHSRNTSARAPGATPTATLPPGVSPTPVAGLPAAPTGYAQFAAPDGAYGLNIPQGWSPSAQSSGVIIAAPDGQSALSIAPITTPFSEAQIPPLLSQTLQGVKGAQNVQVDSAVTPVAFGAYHWSQVKGTFTYHNRPQQAIALFAPHNTAIYMLTFVADQATAAATEANAFQPMVQSFTFLK